MRILSLVIIGILEFLLLWKSDHPHGEDFNISCSTCHSEKGWHIDKDIYSYDHNKAQFPLTGQHKNTECRLCHPTLVFSEAPVDCNACHIDVHQSTAGSDCSRCHTTFSWLVDNIDDIHRMSRFPLLGAHRTADCLDCHKSESHSRFDVLGINCVDCHREDYLSTSEPNHVESGFSEECSSCHSINAFTWEGAGFNHAFFPLSQGHSGLECSSCHTTGNYSDLSPDCNTCHQDDYLATTNPNHTDLAFPDNCELCHTLAPGWSPAAYTQHDSQSFPIYSGRHKGEWSSCTECHTNPSNYSQFTCLSCHEHNKTDMDNAHQEENGYSYDSESCYSCHPRGIADKFHL